MNSTFWKYPNVPMYYEQPQITSTSRKTQQQEGFPPLPPTNLDQCLTLLASWHMAVAALGGI